MSNDEKRPKWLAEFMGEEERKPLISIRELIREHNGARWIELFDDDDLQLIFQAECYVAGSFIRFPGHNLICLIARMAQVLDHLYSFAHRGE